MVFLYINQKNYNKGDKNLVEKLDELMGKKNNKIFILIFMEGCGPCAATRPEWAKLKNVLSEDLLNRDDIVYIKNTDDASLIFGSMVNIEGGVNYFFNASKQQRSETGGPLEIWSGC